MICGPPSSIAGRHTREEGDHGQTHDEITQNLAERLCWETARRDDSRVARRLYRKQLVDGGSRLDEGALLDDFFHVLQAIGVMSRLEEAHGAAIQREMVPFVQYVLLYGVKTLFGIESMHALPTVLCSDEAFMQLVDFNAQQACQGICQRGRPRGRASGFQGRSARKPWPEHRAMAPAGSGDGVSWGHSGPGQEGVFGTKVTGIADGTDLETTARDTGGGQVTRKVHIEDKQGADAEIEVGVRLASVSLDRCRHQDAIGGQCGADSGA